MRCLFAITLLLAGSAHAAPDVTAYRITSGQLSGAALNATASARTVTISLGNLPANREGKTLSKLRLGVAYTYSAATTVTAQFSCAYSSSGYRRTTRSCSGGGCTVYLQSDTYTTGAASASFELEYDIRGCASASIVLGGASADGGDLVTTEAVAMVGE